jgi:hypothetical protein
LKLSFSQLLPFAALLFFSYSVPAQQNAAGPIPFSQAPYRVGERLTYNVSFAQFVDAGHVELFVAGRGTFFNREGIALRAHVETTGTVNAALYAVNNDYTTYVDPANGLPYRAQQVVREAGRSSDTSSDYNQPVGTAAIPGKFRAGEFPGTYDLISAIYRARAVPLTNGAEYYFSVQAEGAMYEAELKVTGTEVIKTNVGSFNTIVTRLSIKGGKVKDYRIYFSDDERHVPVLLTARHEGGDIRIELAGSQMLSITAPQPQPRPTPVPTPIIGKPPLGGPPVGGGLLPADLPFKVGEQLNFQVYIASVTQAVGTASFEVRSRSRYFNRDGLMVTVRAQTTNAAQRIFFANDQINSYLDPATLVPFRSELNLVEGKRRFNRVWTIDQDRGIAVGDNNERVDIPVGTYDLISILYAVRTFDLAPPRRNAISVLVNNRPKTLFITSLKREVIELAGQKISAIQVSLTTDDPQSDKFQLRAWISTDQKRLPLRLSALTEIGPLRADLVIIPTSRQ